MGRELATVKKGAGVAVTAAAPACKICDCFDVSELYRMHHPYEETPFSLLECRNCAFRFIDHLDLDGEGCEAFAAADVENGLEFNRARIEENAAVLIEAVPSGNVLDVGCGAGGFMLAVRDRYHVEGVEVAARFADHARGKGLAVTDRPIDHPSWNGRRGSFDAVTLWDVIEHVNHPLDVARRANELLKPGGVLLLDTPTRDGLLYRMGDWLAWLTHGRRSGTMGVQYSSSPLCHKQIFRRSDMRRMLERAGFRNVAIEQKLELSFPLEHYTRLFVRNPALRAMLSPLVRLFFRLTPIKNKMIVRAWK